MFTRWRSGYCDLATPVCVERRPFNLGQVINHDYTYSDMQPVLYVIPSYAELKEVTRKYIESF